MIDKAILSLVGVMRSLLPKGGRPETLAARAMMRDLGWHGRGFAFAQAMAFPRDGVRGDDPAGNGRVAGSNALEAYFEQHEQGPGICKWRHYFEVYDRHLRKFVGREVHILEIGIYSGGSLGMWKSYFGDRCHVYGVDIEPACKIYEEPSTRIFIGDQADRGFWRSFKESVPRLDIVIDDGGHLPEQQAVSLEELLPHLSPGGVYICEDIHNRFNPFHTFISSLAQELHATKWDRAASGFASMASDLQRRIASVHIYPFIAAIELATRDAPVRFEAPRHGSEWQPFKLV